MWQTISALIRRCAGRQLIYYSHSRRTWGAPKEAAELIAIQKAFPKGTVLNPKTLRHYTTKQYLRHVEDADALVFSTLEAHVGRGVYTEVTHALKAGKKVYLLDGDRLMPWHGTFRVIGIDWKVHYAQPVAY